jgi:hypothetical protein
LTEIRYWEGVWGPVLLGDAEHIREFRRRLGLALLK